MVVTTNAEGVEILDVITPAYSEILTPEALRFLAELARRFEATRVERLAARVKVQAAIDDGALPDFPVETADIRAKE
jgi:malate synthase